MSKKSSVFSIVRSRKLYLPILLGLIITFGACAAMKNQEAMQVERTLAAAGFPDEICRYSGENGSPPDHATAHPFSDPA